MWVEETLRYDIYGSKIILEEEWINNSNQSYHILEGHTMVYVTLKLDTNKLERFLHPSGRLKRV